MFPKVIQDPLYQSIRLCPVATELLDTSSLQRLSRIRQLGFAQLVYRSATHTRFEHVLGAYHLASEVIGFMRERGEITPDLEEDAALLPLAALLHDAGHAPGSHSLEYLHLDWADHEVAGERWITEGEIGEILNRLPIEGAADRIAEMIRHEGRSPLRHLVAGAVDVDRLDYMRRDAYFCGLPMGFNQERLLGALMLANDPESGEPSLMLYEKGLHPLDQMIWHRFSLYQTVYWHRVVRSASVMLRGLILCAVENGYATIDEVQTWDDEQLLHVLQERVACLVGESATRVRKLATRLVRRDLYKPAIFLPMGAIEKLSPASLRRVESALSRYFGIEEGGAFLDMPSKPGMFEPDIRVVMKDGRMIHLRDLGPEEGFVTNAATASLYRAAGRVAVYTSSRCSISEAELMRIVEGER